MSEQVVDGFDNEDKPGLNAVRQIAIIGAIKFWSLVRKDGTAEEIRNDARLGLRALMIMAGKDEILRRIGEADRLSGDPTDLSGII